MEIVLHKKCYAIGIWKKPTYGRIEQIYEDRVAFREIPLTQCGFKKGGCLYEVMNENLIEYENETENETVNR